MWIPFESVLRGQHFYNSVRIALGLLLIALIFYFTNDLPTAASVMSGALCVSSADTPSPWRHKLFEVFTGFILGTVIYVLTWAVHSSPFLMGIFIFIVSFFLSFTPLYGKKAIPLSFTGSFAIVLALGASTFNNFDMLRSIELFIYGGICFSLYSLLSAFFFIYRLRLQVFAESTFEIAKYLKLKSHFYEEGFDFEVLHPELVSQQAKIVEVLQTARDFIFRDIKNQRDKKLARMLIMQIDVFETLMAGNTDYELIQSKYEGSEIMLFMRDLMIKMSRNMELIAVTALRGKSPRTTMSFKAELFAIAHYLEILNHDTKQDPNALSELSDIYEKVSMCTEKVDELRKVQATDDFSPENTLFDLNLADFTTSYRVNFKMIREHLTFDSPHTRYALRAAFAMEAGYIISILLSLVQDHAVSRSYWIFLTIAVVLRSNFSTTIQRRTDRIIGTIIGCTVAALLLHGNPSEAILIFFLFWAQVTVRTFGAINYRITSAAGSLVALMQIAFLNPDQPFTFWERLVDTGIGAIIAYIACFVLPMWESRNIPELARNVAEANAHYMRVVFTFGTSDEAYRLARKKMLDELAALSEAFSRMTKEPQDKRIAVRETGRYLTLNYLFAARIASINMLLTRIEAQCPKQRFFPHRLEEARANLDLLFKKASDLLGGVPPTVRETDTKDTDNSKAEPAPDSGKAELFNLDYNEQRFISILELQIESASKLLSEMEEVDSHLVEEWHKHHVNIRS